MEFHKDTMKRNRLRGGYIKLVRGRDNNFESQVRFYTRYNTPLVTEEVDVVLICEDTGQVIFFVDRESFGFLCVSRLFAQYIPTRPLKKYRVQLRRGLLKENSSAWSESLPLMGRSIDYYEIFWLREIIDSLF